MMLYRLKSIEAIQWLGWEKGPATLGIEQIDTPPPHDDHVNGFLRTGQMIEQRDKSLLEDTQIVHPGDWVITRPDGTKQIHNLWGDGLPFLDIYEPDESQVASFLR